MRFIGIDPHTNKFTCCYREEDSTSDGKRLETFTLDSNGLEAFYQTLTLDTYVLIYEEDTKSKVLGIFVGEEIYYTRSAPRVKSSNTSVSIKGTNKQGRKLSANLISQSLNHVLAASKKLNK